MTKARFLGTSALSDAFSVAFLLPNLFRRLFAEGSVSVAFIPTFKEYLLGDDREKTKEFLSCFFTFLTFFVTLMVMAGILAAPFLVRLFGVEEYDETVLLSRVMFPFLGFISLAALFQGVLNSLHVFAPSGFAPILLNVVTILSAYWLSPYTQNPARAMAVGILAGGFLEAAIQFPFVIKHGQKFFITGLKRAAANPGTRKVLRLISPTVIGMAAYQINDLVSTALAGRSGEGVVSSLQYSLRLQELILGVFAVSIGTVLLPDLAEYAKTTQWGIYNKRLVSAMDIIALITIPITFFSLAEGQNLIRLLFQSRSFDETSVSLTLAAFTCHMPGLLFIALNRVLAPAFYAQSDTKSPALAGIISFAVNITLAAILVRPFRGAGIAFALSFASAVNTVLLLVFLGRKSKREEFTTNNTNEKGGVVLWPALGFTLLYILRLSVISILALIPLHFLSPLLQKFFTGRGRVISYGVPLAINVTVYAAFGLAMLGIMRDKYIFALVRLFGRKGIGSRE
jgi:putative peptidoglycan lipid II flippase